MLVYFYALCLRLIFQRFKIGIIRLRRMGPQLMASDQKRQAMLVFFLGPLLTVKYPAGYLAMRGHKKTRLWGVLFDLAVWTGLTKAYNVRLWLFSILNRFNGIHCK